MRQIFKFGILFVFAGLLFSACGGKKDGSPMEVLPKKIYQQIDGKYAEINDFYEGLACVRCKVDGETLYGYIDNKGKEVIPCIYDYAGWFSEGVAVVQKGSGTGVIGKKGEIIVPLEYYSVDNCEHGVILVQEDWSTYGAFDAKGRQIIPFEYSYLGSPYDGMILAKNEERMYGYFNLKGDLVIDFIYDDASHFSEGLAVVEMDKKEICIDTKGKEVFRMPSRYSIWGNFKDGLALTYDNTNDLYGYVNTKGEIAIPCKYADADDFYDGFADVEDEDGNKILINTKGERAYSRYE